MANSEMYRLEVPLAKSGSIGGAARYSCCHCEELVGHAESCTQEMRVRAIDEALDRVGFSYKLECEEDTQEDPGVPSRVSYDGLKGCEDETLRVGGAVNHPHHYNAHPSGIECIDVIEHMTANIAAAMKYVWRAGLKPSADYAEDLAKAGWYIERERVRVARL